MKSRTTRALELSQPERARLLHWYGQMTLIQGVEERLSAVAKTGDLPGPIHVSVGQEAVAVGVTSGLRGGDWVASTHRGHGHFLALGGDPRHMVAEIYGRATGICRGKGGSMHVADYGRGIIGANGIVGAGIGLAAGAALSCRIAGCRRGPLLGRDGMTASCRTLLAHPSARQPPIVPGEGG